MPSRKSGQKAEREHQYFRVVITYSDGETSGNRVFNDRAKAERWAERQKRSGVVKKVAVEPFVRDAYAASKLRRGPGNADDLSHLTGAGRVWADVRVLSVRFKKCNHAPPPRKPLT